MDLSRVVTMTWHKWPSQLHWEATGVLLARDSGSTWLGTTKGSPILRPQGRTPTAASGDSVLVCSPSRPWVARWYLDRGDAGRAERFSCYVDITTLPVISEDRVLVIDLDLDVALTWEGDMVLLDEDEFTDHAVRFGYPAWLERHARDACQEVQDLLASHGGPFDGQHQQVIREWRSHLGRSGIG